MSRQAPPRIDRRLLRQLGMDDWREFAIEFGAWAHTKDFTYQSDLYDPHSGATFLKLLKQFVKERSIT